MWNNTEISKCFCDYSLFIICFYLIQSEEKDAPEHTRLNEIWSVVHEYKLKCKYMYISPFHPWALSYIIIYWAGL